MYEEEKNKIKKRLMSEETYGLLKKKKCFLAGGSIIGLFNGYSINDLDIYCRNSDDALELAFELRNTYTPTYVDHKSIVMSGEFDPINIITFRYFDSLESIFDTYDFTVCMGGYDFAKDEFEFHPRFFKDNMAKRLYYSSGSQYPLGAVVRRMSKYQEKGYSISRKELLKMVLDCFKLDLSTPEKLKDQITGMYGTDIDELLPKGQEFSLPAVVKALDHVSDAIISREEFKHYKDVNIAKAFPNELTLMKLKDNFVYQTKKDKLLFDLEIPDKEEDEEEKELPKIKFPIKAYKFVQKDPETGKLVAFWDKRYEYKVGEWQEPANKSNGLWGYLEGQEDSMKYANREDAVKIYLLIEKEEDIQTFNLSSASFNRVKVLSVEEPIVIPDIRIDPMAQYQDF